MRVSAWFLVAIGCLILTGCAEKRDEGIIVFQSSRDGNFEIYSMNSDGTNQQRLTNSPTNDVSPCWSPDGTTIAFASDRTGNWEIYSMHSDGSNVLQLTHGQGSNTAPAWVESGRKILFVSTRDAINGDLYLMNPDGGGVERVTADSTVKDSPVMSGDGKSIYFTVNTKGRYSIALFSFTDKTLRQLTPSGSDCLDPVLSAAGDRLLFVSDREGHNNIYMMSTTGADMTRLTEGKGDAMTPAWTTNEGEILVSKGGSICLLSLNDKKERILSFKGDSFPNWHKR